MVFSLPVVGIAGSPQRLDQGRLGDRPRAVRRRVEWPRRPLPAAERATRASPPDQAASLSISSGVSRGFDPARPRSGSSRARRTIVATSSALKRLQHHDAAPREQGRIDLERGVLGRRPDQADRAVLDGPQQGVLLRLVEAMDLVDEEDRPPASRRRLFLASSMAARTSRTPANTAERAMNRRSVALGDQPGQGRLARAGRSPEDE